MKIIALEAENVKVLKAVDIHPNGSTVVIGGENGQGKSSVLDCISYALGGKDLVCEDPVRHGEKTARIKLDMGEIVVVRKFGVGESLKISKPDGSVIPSPQKFLDEIYGSLSFDPLEFSRMKPKDQAQTLRDLVGLDTSAIDERIRIAEVVSVGESDGRLSTRPVDICSCSLASRDSPVWSDPTERSVSMFCVTLWIGISGSLLSG